MSFQKRQNTITEVILRLFWALTYHRHYLIQVYADIKTFQYPHTFLHISKKQTNATLERTPCNKSCYVMRVVSHYQPLCHLSFSCALGVSEDAKHGSNVIQVLVSVTKALRTFQHWMKLHPYTKANLVKVELCGVPEVWLWG